MLPTTPSEDIFWSETSSHLLVSELNFMVDGQINERHFWSFSEQIISSSNNKPRNINEMLNIRRFSKRKSQTFLWFYICYDAVCYKTNADNKYQGDENYFDLSSLLKTSLIFCEVYFHQCWRLQLQVLNINETICAVTEARHPKDDLKTERDRMCAHSLSMPTACQH